MDPISLEAGSVVGDFRLRRRVVRSRWTSVFSAESERYRGTFAVKVFDLNGSNEKAIGKPDEQIWIERFLLEGRILETMDHPGIIALQDRGVLEDGRPYHVMPFIAANLIYEMGGDTSDPEKLARLAPPRRPKPLSPERAFYLLTQITDALAALHARDIIHRDLKPGNILLAKKMGGDAILCDFGMARWGVQVFDAPGELIGSKDYVSPEQKREPASSGAQADIYSLGRMAYRMLVGKLPDDKKRSIRAVNDGIPRELDELIASCIEDNPSNRPDDAQVLMMTLNGIKLG